MSETVQVNGRAIPLLFGQHLNEASSSGVELKRESPRARLMLMLVAQGLTDQHIARELDITAQTVSKTRRQPWFIENLVKLIHEKGEPAIERRLNNVAAEMIELGRELAINADSEAVRATSILGLLKLARGEKVVVEDKRESLEEIKTKRAEIERQLAEIKGDAPKRDVGEEVTKGL